MLSRLVIILFVMGVSACAAPPPQGPVYAAPPAARTLAEKLANDEQRIREGIQFRQLTSSEINELQGRHAAIEGTRREQLAQGGGRFLPGQYEQLLAREDALSHAIFDYRHNGATPSAH